MIKLDRFTLIVVFIVFLDQISKSMATKVVKNYGASFGLLAGYNWLLILISFFVIGLIIYYKERIKSYGFIGLSIFMGGVIGNLVDRLVFGYVRDFLSFLFWPAFNIADVCNVVGVVILIIYFLRKN